MITHSNDNTSSAEVLNAVVDGFAVVHMPTPSAGGGIMYSRWYERYLSYRPDGFWRGVVMPQVRAYYAHYDSDAEEWTEDEEVTEEEVSVAKDELRKAILDRDYGDIVTAHRVRHDEEQELVQYARVPDGLALQRTIVIRRRWDKRGDLYETITREWDAKGSLVSVFKY
jgi:hypothetical protein